MRDSSCAQNSLVWKSFLVLDYLKDKQKFTLWFKRTYIRTDMTWYHASVIWLFVTDCSRGWQVAFGKSGRQCMQLILVFDADWRVTAFLEGLVFDGAFKHRVRPSAQTFWKRYLFMVPTRCTKILHTIHPGISSFIQRRSNQHLDILLNEYSSGQYYFPCYL